MNTRIIIIASIVLTVLAAVGVSSAHRPSLPLPSPSALPERAANLPAADRPTLAPRHARPAAATPVSSIAVVTATVEVRPVAKPATDPDAKPTATGQTASKSPLRLLRLVRRCFRR